MLPPQVNGAWDLETALVASLITSIGSPSSQLAVYMFWDSVQSIGNATRAQAAGLVAPVQYAR